MTTNCNLTIYNRKINPDTRKYEYSRTFLEAVHWHTDQKTNVGDKGLVSADAIKVRIPMEDRKGYIPPEQYKALEFGAHRDHWTIENGDLIIHGEAIEEIEKESDIVRLGAVKVVSHSENMTGTAPHIRIGGSS